MIIARIYLVRHGETEENRTGILQGQLDTVLNDTGIKQAQLLAWRFKETRIDAAFTSDLSRASKTAQAILRHHPHVQLVEQTALRERHLGELQGTRAVPGWKMRMKSSETDEAYIQRATEWWMTLLLRCISSSEEAAEPRNILVVSHSGFIGTLVRVLLARGQLFCEDDVAVGRCHNTSVAVVEVHAQEIKGEKWVIEKSVLVKYGDVSHLKEQVSDTSWDCGKENSALSA